MTESKRSLQVSEELCRQIETRFAGTHFANIEELITFLLRELVQDDALQMDAEEERIIEKRLRDLGYL